MNCGSCQRWRRLDVMKNGMPSTFGRCRWAGSEPAPYWHAQHPSGHLLVHFTHGAECKAAVAFPSPSNPGKSRP